MQPDPRQLIDALTANGFTTRNEGEDGFGPRGWTVWYPQRVDPTLRITAAPHTTAHAMAELARVASNGRRASAVLASLGAQQQDAPDITDALFPLLQQVRDRDSLDITDEEILEGHHRITEYAWLAVQAYWLGAASRNTVKSSTDEENQTPARDPGPTHRAQSNGRSALDIARDLRLLVSDRDGTSVLSQAANTLESLTFRLAEECTARGVAQAWLDVALPFLRDGALGEHHAKCGESSQWDIRRCEDAHCLERAGVLELYGLLPKAWDTYPIPAPAGLDLSGAAQRITASAADASLCGDTWLPAGLADPAAIQGWAHAGGTELPVLPAIGPVRSNPDQSMTCGHTGLTPDGPECGSAATLHLRTPDYSAGSLACDEHAPIARAAGMTVEHPTGPDCATPNPGPMWIDGPPSRCLRAAEPEPAQPSH